MHRRWASAACVGAWECGHEAAASCRCTLRPLEWSLPTNLKIGWLAVQSLVHLTLRGFREEEMEAEEGEQEEAGHGGAGRGGGRGVVEEESHGQFRVAVACSRSLESISEM